MEKNPRHHTPAHAGFTLMEVLIALFFLSVGAGGAFVLLQRMIGFSSGSVSRLEGTYLAQEGVEIVRNIRDSNFLKIYKGAGGAWTDGLLNCQNGCEADEDAVALVPYSDRVLKISDNLYSYQSGADSQFKRKITVLQSDANTLIVTVDVFWNNRGIPQSVEASGELYNWLSL